MNWSSHETWLVVRAAVSIAVIVLLISYFKVHAFVALIVESGLVGLASGL